MIIKNMFLKPIDRNIKGVIKVGQADDENVKQELEEYVVTRELQKHFADFFASYKRGINGTTDKTGVWISGFFGSGKSHFLKILSYLLANKNVDNKKPIDYFIDDNKINDEFVLGDMKLAANTPADVILFNIDSKSGMADTQNNKEAILSVFLKVFNQHLGFYGDNPHIADLERNLVEENKYEEFKTAFAKIRGREWTDSRHQFRFIQDDVCKALAEIDYMTMEAARNACESFTAPYNMDINTFAKMIKDHIDKQGDNHHVVFLVDEIGQYIGEKTDLMLNLQTVVEDLGAECMGKAWIIVTSQQDIDSITKTIGNDFSKIQGRFDTRLSLSSANVDEVIQKRILDKTETGKQTLSILYDEKEIIIKNLITFNDNIEKKLYSNGDNFANVYPFIPYQFNLLGSVLTEIRKHGASGKHLAEGERSMLALFKESAMKVMNEEETVLVPFNLFYDALEQFLDHSHKSVISRAYDNNIINPEKTTDCFSVNVLKVLFMIKYIKEIPASIENITSLMISNIDEDRKSLKEKTEQALINLCSQTLVQKNNDLYIFLTDEEQEINREIKNQNIETSELMRKVSEAIFDGFISDNSYTLQLTDASGSYTRPFKYNQFLDEKPFKSNQNFDITLKIITPNNTEIPTDEKALKLNTSNSSEVMVILPDNKNYIDEIDIALKIDKYLRLNTANTLAIHNDIKSNKRIEASKRRENAKIFLEEAFNNADIYVNGEKLANNQKPFNKRLDEAMENLIYRVFNKISYITNTMNDNALKELFTKENIVILNIEDVNITNNLASNDVLDYITLNKDNYSKISLKNIVDRFTSAPYGFIETDVKYLVGDLFKRGEIALYLNNEELTFINKSQDELFRYLTKKEFLDKLLIIKRERANDRQKKVAKNILREVFYKTIDTDDDDTIISSFKEACNKYKTKLETMDKVYFNNTNIYPGNAVIKNGIVLITAIPAIKNSNEFFDTIVKKENEFLDFGEDFEPIDAFFNGEQVKIWDSAYDLMRIYNSSKTFIYNNEVEAKAGEINEILKKENPYSDIRRLPELIEEYRNLYLEELEKISDDTKAKIKIPKDRVLAELENKECKEQLINKVNNSFNELDNKRESSNNIAELKNIQSEADALKMKLLDEIERTENKILIEKAKELSEKENVQKPVIKKKEQKYISIKEINPEYVWRIENQKDINNYIEKLKYELEKNIDENTILNIEF